MGVGDGFRNDSGLGVVDKSFLRVFKFVLCNSTIQNVFILSTSHENSSARRTVVSLYDIASFVIVRGPKEHARCSRRGCSSGLFTKIFRQMVAQTMIFDFLSHWIRPPLELLGAKPARSACSFRPFQIHVAAHRRQAYQIHARRMRLMERCSHQIPCGRRHRMKDDRAS